VHVASQEDFWELEQLVFFILHIDVEIELEIPARPPISNIIFPVAHVTESADSDFFTKIADSKIGTGTYLYCIHLK
jgi:hypothetical protein